MHLETEAILRWQNNLEHLLRFPIAIAFPFHCHPTPFNSRERFPQLRGRLPECLTYACEFLGDFQFGLRCLLNFVCCSVYVVYCLKAGKSEILLIVITDALKLLKKVYLILNALQKLKISTTLNNHYVYSKFLN